MQTAALACCIILGGSAGREKDNREGESRLRVRVRDCAPRARVCVHTCGRGGERVAGQVVKQPPHDFLARAIPSGGETEREGGEGATRGLRRARSRSAHVSCPTRDRIARVC